MCGVRQWGCEKTGSRQRKQERIRALTEAPGARVLLLQEVCSGDLSAARKRLGESWHSTFEPYVSVSANGSRSEVRCAESEQGTAGFAILSAWPLTSISHVVSAQPSAGLRRGILCATVAAERVRVCNAHLSPPGSDRAHPTWELRDDQLKALVRAASGQRTVFGGDLNTAPPGVAGNSGAWVWPSSLYTSYRECDQSGSSRAGRYTHQSGYKIDYLFTALPRSGCTVLPSGASDHWALAMQVVTGQSPVSTSGRSTGRPGR
ncbi:endonuclease/exonuclease/phosphatase family protein [Streptomyces sp. NPDC051320]|uniref:endonuclease/exonuclease/phosphatase family protein n=1 Tax=Streptomyces sp. NPDC051320 TaxID=3154644 RepID=UPI00343709D2